LYQRKAKKPSSNRRKKDGTTGPIIVAKFGAEDESVGSEVEVEMEVDVDVGVGKLKSGALISHASPYRLTDKTYH
jgi:hypothetical protein